MSEEEVKLIFEMNLADYLSLLVLPCSYTDLILQFYVSSKSALFSNIAQHTQTKTTTANKNKTNLIKDIGIYNGFHKTNNHRSKIHQK